MTSDGTQGFGFAREALHQPPTKLQIQPCKGSYNNFYLKSHKDVDTDPIPIL